MPKGKNADVKAFFLYFERKERLFPAKIRLPLHKKV